MPAGPTPPFAGSPDRVMFAFPDPEAPKPPAPDPRAQQGKMAALGLTVAAARLAGIGVATLTWNHLGRHAFGVGRTLSFPQAWALHGIVAFVGAAFESGRRASHAQAQFVRERRELIEKGRA